MAESPNSLYDENLATYTSADTFDKIRLLDLSSFGGLQLGLEVQKNVE